MVLDHGDGVFSRFFSYGGVLDYGVDYGASLSLSLCAASFVRGTRPRRRRFFSYGGVLDYGVDYGASLSA